MGGEIKEGQLLEAAYLQFVPLPSIAEMISFA